MIIRNSAFIYCARLSINIDLNKNVVSYLLRDCTALSAFSKALSTSLKGLSSVLKTEKNSAQMVLAWAQLPFAIRLPELTVLAFNGIFPGGLKGVGYGAQWVVKGVS